MFVNAREFISRARKYARNHNLEFLYDPRHGKGSHGRVFVGNRLTTVKSANKQLGKGLVRRMLRDLDIHPKEF